MKEKLVNAIADMKEDEAIRLVQAMLDAGTDPQVILDACREAMTIVGSRYEKKEYFLPELDHRGRDDEGDRRAGQAEAAEGHPGRQPSARSSSGQWPATSTTSARTCVASCST